jgi:hypothetical protein
MSTNKRLTHQPITRKTIVYKTLNLIHFFFLPFLVRKKKNQKKNQKKKRTPNHGHPRRRHYSTLKIAARPPHAPRVAARPSGSTVAAAAGWDRFFFF